MTRHYNPYVHLFVPALVGVGIAIAAILSVKEFQAVELLAIPASLLVGNFVEWWSHKSILHKPKWWARPVWKQHTLHHQMFTHEGMSWSTQGANVWSDILMPLRGMLLIVVALSVATPVIA